MDNNFRSGFVAIIGRPNVGKSTLMNHLIGQKIAITSNKPQTTRNKIQTVYTCDEGQIVFLDTPGIHKAKNKLGEYMVQVAERTLKEVDAIMWLVEPSTFVGAGERHIAEQLQKVGVPVILIINKIDTVKKEELLHMAPRGAILKALLDKTVLFLFVLYSIAQTKYKCNHSSVYTAPPARNQSLVSHIPQNASTGLFPLNSDFPVIFSTACRIASREPL